MCYAISTSNDLLAVRSYEFLLPLFPTTAPAIGIDGYYLPTSMVTTLSDARGACRRAKMLKGGATGMAHHRDVNFSTRGHRREFAASAGAPTYEGDGGDAAPHVLADLLDTVAVTVDGRILE